MIAIHCLRIAQYTHIKQSDIQTLQEVSVVKLSVGGSDGSLQGPRQIVEEKHLCRLGQLRPNEVEGRDQKSIWGMHTAHCSVFFDFNMHISAFDWLHILQHNTVAILICTLYTLYTVLKYFLLPTQHHTPSLSLEPSFTSTCPTRTHLPTVGPISITIHISIPTFGTG